MDRPTKRRRKGNNKKKEDDPRAYAAQETQKLMRGILKKTYAMQLWYK